MLLLTLILLVRCVLSNRSIEYLQQYGYLGVGDLNIDISPAVTSFQEVFNLTIDGTLNNETLHFMEQPRCGVKDTVYPFSADPSTKWEKPIITWYMYGDTVHVGLVERAFKLWERHTNLEFIRMLKEPDIYISMSNRIHIYFANKSNCLYPFYGPGGAVAHAYFPYNFVNHTDIHMDKEENWDFTMNIPPSNSVSFYLTLVHEIGHALGLQHSYVKTSTMYPIYSVPFGISNLEEYDLDKDDINAIQFLYGEKSKVTTTSSSTTTTSTSTTTTTTSTSTLPTTSTQTAPSSHEATLTEIDLCTYKNEINTFLILKDKLYVFYKTYAWVLHIEPSRRTPEEMKQPYIIAHWLNFLPDNFTHITAIYQKKNGDVAIFVNDYVYYVSLPSFNLITKQFITNLIRASYRKINTAFRDYNGRTFVLYDDKFVVEVNECNNWGQYIGLTTDIFETVPGKLAGAFRYINGNLYFITTSHSLEYNEFTNIVNRSVIDIFDVLRINCIRESLLNQLYNVLKYLQ